MLIHEPPPREERAALEPNWTLCFWLLVAAGAWLGAGNTSGVIAFLLLCATLGAICKAATEAIGYAEGLGEWRQ